MTDSTKADETQVGDDKSAIKERPIIFSGEMVRAILEGRKTQTRRVVKPQPTLVKGVPHVRPDFWTWKGLDSLDCGALWLFDKIKASSRYGNRGDRLWVRETWIKWPFRRDMDSPRVVYEAEGELDGVKWKSPIFMPRKLSRITLEITDVRVERVQGITEADCRAEGIAPERIHDPANPDTGILNLARPAFWRGWDELNAKRGYSWLDNPFVWVINFKVISPGESHA